ncbi:MAG: hypothetical protein H0T13_08305, partial [Actinobacteria bacterium]|nr:hypothetical protein [Actinomycetota bacterium]
AERPDVVFVGGTLITATATYNAAARTITRAEGAWTGIAPGNVIRVDGITLSSPIGVAYYTVAAVAGNVLTISGAAMYGTVPVIANQTGAPITVTLIVDPSVTTTVSFDAAARTITRSSGTWTTISAGQTIKVSGVTPNANDAYSFYTVLSVSGSVITLASGDVLTTQSGIPNVTVRPVALNPTFERRGGVSGLAVTITDNGFNTLGRVGDTITRTSGSWISDGFVKGALLKIGSGENATDAFTSFTITDVTATTLTLSSRDILAAESGSIDLSWGYRPATTRLIIDQSDDVDVTAYGTLNVTATGNVLIGSGETLKLGVIDTPGRTSIKTSASILSANGAGSPGTTCGTAAAPTNVNVCTGDLILEASTGSIGTQAAPIFLDTEPGATVTARAGGDIWLYNRLVGGGAGDLELETVFSSGGKIRLESDGSILDGLDTDFTKVKADHIEFVAGGTIGADGNPLETDSGDAGTGDLTALAGSSIWLTETDGALQIRLVKSITGDVTIVAPEIQDGPDVTSQNPNGGLFGPDANTGPSRPTVDVVGNNITLTATSGRIGAAGNDLDIDSAFSGPGTLTSSSTLANTYIIEPFGDLAINSVSTSGNKIAFITALAGAILNGRTDGGDNVESGKVWLFARDNIGISSKWLTTSAGLLQGRSTTADVYISNTGAIEIGCVSDFPTTGCDDPNGITAPTGVFFTAGGAGQSGIKLTKNVEATSGPVQITSADTGDDNSVVITPGRTIVSGSTVTITSGDHIDFQEGSSVTATGAIVMTADAGAGDAAIGSITLTNAIVQSGDSITATASDFVYIWMDSFVNAVNNVAFTAGTNLTVFDPTYVISSTGSVDLIALGGDVTLSTDIVVTAAVDVTLAASVNVVLHENVIVTAEHDIRITATDGDALLGLANTPVTVSAGRNVLIEAGNDIHQWDAASVTAANTIAFHGDGIGAVDPAGTTILIEGAIAAVLTEVFGDADADLITYTPWSLVGHTQIWGGDSTDEIIIDQLPSVDLAQKLHPSASGPDALVTGNEAVRARNMVDVDGQGAQDYVTVNLTGVDGTDYIVRVRDTGDPGNGADVLTINGTDDADSFLVRANYASVEGLAFVARMQPTGGATDFAPTYERVNYDRTINVLRLNGGDGNDRFYSDDSSAIMTIDGGNGDDYFQFGQLFGAPRVSLYTEFQADQDGDGTDEQLSTIGTVATGDELTTLQTTRGFLTRGISFPAVVYGGDGQDEFVVYSNKALLKLFGEDGNDEFLIRAFLIKNSSAVSTDETVLSGGGGDDRIEYNINAPVSIDGGEGVDTVVVVGTEAADNFVITADAVFGAGLAIEYTGVERVDVDGMEGDDHFFILSTNAKVITTIIGGLGNDTFDVGGDVTKSIIALSVEGVSSTVNHSVASADPIYNGIFAPGIRLNVANAATGAVVVEESGGTSIVTEDGGSAAFDSYTIRFAVTPTVPTVAYMTVSAALSPSKELLQGAGSVEVSTDGITWHDALVLTFDTSDGGANAWGRTQTIFMRAVSDTVQEGERTVVISHSLQSANAAFDRINIRNVEVRTIDDDKPDVTIEQTGTSTSVVEGILTDTYTVKLTRSPNPGETVVVTLVGDFTQLAVSADLPVQASRFDATARTITFDETNWDDAFVVRVTAVDDTIPENRMFRTLFHEISTTGGLYDGPSAIREQDVEIRDNDTGGVLVVESDGATLVSPGVPDTYTLRLTRAPTAPVTVSVFTDGKTIASSGNPADARWIPGVGTTMPAVVFDQTNWNLPFLVSLAINPAWVDLSTGDPQADQPEMFFPAQEHVVANLFGPLVIEGGKIKDRPLINGAKLPTETDIPLPIVLIETDETQQTDTLNVFNDGSVADDVGTLGLISALQAHALGPIYALPPTEDVDATKFAQIGGLGMGGPRSFDFGTPAAPDVRTFAAGITYHEVEVVDIMLGQGDDEFTIDATLEGSITVVQGGGNRTPTGADRITVNGGGGASSPLIIFGDTSQDGSFYDTVTAAITGRAREFQYAGNDVIDAHNATQSVAIYGGAGDDVIIGSQAGDHLAGGSGNDTIYGQDGLDHIYGDSGFNLDLSKRLSLSTQILSVATAPGPDDNVARPGHFQTSDSLIAGNDVLHGEGGDDLVFGDHGVIAQVDGINRVLTTGDVIGLLSVRLNNSGSDVITGGDGQDVLIGGGAGDAIDGGTGDDLLFGDAVGLSLRAAGDITTGRFQALLGSLLYARPDVAGSPTGVESGTLLTNGVPLDYRNADGSAPYWAQFLVTDLWHSFAIEAGADPVAGPNSFGNDYLAGNAGNDMLFGQLGDDTLQGDGSIDSWLYGTPVGATRTGQTPENPIGDLVLVPSFEAATDGDDYVEGGGGNDVIFGGLGQDDLVGGSSSFFGLTSPALRPDGADLIFGGAGTKTDRNTYGDGLQAPDADVIAADNANIVRIVNPDGSAPVFNYDLHGSAADGYGPQRIAVRGVELLDYTPGGPDFRPDLFGTGQVAGCGRDIGGGDEVHGESGADTVYGGCGNDALYGDAGDDDLIGGWGSDFISGGTGQDGILGDDGRILTSRNSDLYGEPLAGVAPIATDDLDARISAQLGAQVTVINPSGALKKTADLTPFGLDPNAATTAPDDVLFDPLYADDIIFGGLGSDFLHGGAGDDAISGAEALLESYGQRYDAAGHAVGTVRIDFLHPYNPSDALHFGPDTDAWDPGLVLTTGSPSSPIAGTALLTDQSGMLERMGEFALYDEYDPRRRIQLNADGSASKDGTGGEFFLNFDAADSGAPTVTDPRTTTPNWGTVQTDGDDVLFGDLGNDWLVGGTGRDSLYGGFGNDLLNADDDLGTNGGLNDRPDTHPSYEDMAFGGAGLDILIANTGGDRLIDWQGDFNSFIVPFSWYSLPTISRWFVPELDDLTYRLFGYQLDSLSSDGCYHRLPLDLESGSCRNLTLEEYLYQRSASEGADPTRATDTGTDTASQGNRNGEPRGELGLVAPRDRDYWRDQEGIPSDPPGLIPFQRRDVAYSAVYEDGTTLPFT